RRRHTRFSRDWSSDVCSSDLEQRFLALSIRVGISDCSGNRSVAAGPGGRPELPADSPGSVTDRGDECGGDAAVFGGNDEGDGAQIGRASGRERGGSWGVAGEV